MFGKLTKAFKSGKRLLAKGLHHADNVTKFVTKSINKVTDGYNYGKRQALKGVDYVDKTAHLQGKLSTAGREAVFQFEHNPFTSGVADGLQKLKHVNNLAKEQIHNKDLNKFVNS